MSNTKPLKLEVYAPKQVIQTKDTLSRNALIMVLFFAKQLFNNPDQQEYTMPVGMIYELFGHKEREYRLVKETLRELTSSSIEWSFFDSDTKELEEWFAAWCAYAKIKQGVITFAFPKPLKELLLKASQVWHATISLPILTQLKSRYSIKIYQECLLYYHQQRQQGETPYRGIAQFKEFLGATGETYEIFWRFNDQVLKPAIKEINSKTGLLITPDFKKSGRVISHIKFVIKPNPNDPLKGINLDRQPEPEPLSEQMKAEIEAFKKRRAERKNKNQNIKMDRGLQPLTF